MTQNSFLQDLRYSNLTQTLANPATAAKCRDVRPVIMAAMECDQLLIKEIIKYPILYDSTRPDYKDAVKKDIAWTTIATLLGLSVADCQRRWKTLRERYVREKKRFKKGNGVTIALSEKWPLFDLMSFLGVFIRHRNSASILPSDDMSLMDTNQFCSVKLEEQSPDSMHEDMPMVVSVTSMTSSSPLPIVSMATIAQSITPVTNISPVSTISPMPTVTSVTTLAPITAISPLGNITSVEPNISSGSTELSQEVFHQNHLNQLDNEHITQSSLNNTKNKLRDPETDKNILKTLDTSIKYLNSLQATHRDAEDHFAMSIACTLRKLPSQKAALAKIKIQQLLYELEFDN